MKLFSKCIRHIALFIFLNFTHLQAQYNNLWIPDTLSGTQFNFTIKDTFAQIVDKGNQTITAGINGKFWGPTLFFNKGDVVHMNVKNNLNDSTTLHWHGFHLHEMTLEQITKGIGGLIIVRDEIEAALALPRNYGIDDIPLVLTDRDFNSQNQFTPVPYGDSAMVNMTLRPQFSVPGQVVRFRFLNAAIERSFNIGFSDNRNFSVICSDGGLLDAPVSVNRYLLHAGERIEIVVDFKNEEGKSVDLKAYNSTLANNVGGGENFTTGPFGNFLGKKDFNLLHINVGPKTTRPVTTIPTTLTKNVLLNVADAKITRSLTISDSAGVRDPVILGPNAFIINHKLFKLDYNEYEVPVGNTEIWQITSTSAFGHPFHIHDVQFNIISVNGVPPTPAQAGWKDVVFVPGRMGPGGAGNIVKFIARFVVTGTSTAINDLPFDAVDFTLYPNPAQTKVFVQFGNPVESAYYIKIINALGKTVIMLPSPELKNGIDISSLKAGVYYMQLTDNSTKQMTSKTFLIQ